MKFLRVIATVSIALLAFETLFIIDYLVMQIPWFLGTYNIGPFCSLMEVPAGIVIGLIVAYYLNEKLFETSRHGKSTSNDVRSDTRLDEARIMSKEPFNMCNQKIIRFEGILPKSHRRVDKPLNDVEKVQEAIMS